MVQIDSRESTDSHGSERRRVRSRTGRLPVITIGDLAMDWFAVPMEDDPRGKRPQVMMMSMRSGAWLLQYFLKRLGKPDNNRHSYFCYEPPKEPLAAESHKWNRNHYFNTSNPNTSNPKEYMHALADLDEYKRGVCDCGCPVQKNRKGASDDKVYRIKTPARYYGSLLKSEEEDGRLQEKRPGRDALRVDRLGASRRRKRLRIDDPDLQKPRLLVIFDGGDEFRSELSQWDDLIPPEKDPDLHIVLFKKPPFPGDSEDDSEPSPLWERIRVHHRHRTVVVISADYLRNNRVNISKNLSWEKTAQDFVTEVDSNPILKELTTCLHLVVRFGLTGAIHYYSNVPSKATLYYDTQRVEGEYRVKEKGDVSGFTALLAATVARALADDLAEDQDNFDLHGETWIPKGIHQGLLNCRILYCHGFGKNLVQTFDPQTFDPYSQNDSSEDTQNEERCKFGSPDESDSETVRNSRFFGKEKIPPVIPESHLPFSRLPSRWKILDGERVTDRLESIAFNIVKWGIEYVLNTEGTPRFPTAKFGKNFWVVDRDEIESFRSISNLLREHRDKTPTTAPLSIAVFGPPGSGKSYGVKEIANSLGDEPPVQFETYNLAEFVEPNELTQALLPIRDLQLDGKLPIVFFDEFDTTLGDKLGWLKYFLPLMQDGQFKHGERMLKIGGPVFVFAGGTSPTYQKFLRQEESVEEQQDFRDRKGPDFISRLRGYVNIRGINQKDPNDKVFVVRRAILLRSILEKHFSSVLLGKDKEAKIDKAVLDALLRVPEYKHGSRSMEAVLHMSRLARAKRFSASILPPNDQLNMHVKDVTRFRKLLKVGQ